MAETLRELVAAMSLEKAISHAACPDNQQIKKPSPAWPLAWIGFENYKKTITGTESKLSMRGQKLTQQQRAVGQYSWALI